MNPGVACLGGRIQGQIYYIVRARGIHKTPGLEAAGWDEEGRRLPVITAAALRQRLVLWGTLRLTSPFLVGASNFLRFLRRAQMGSQQPGLLPPRWAQMSPGDRSSQFLMSECSSCKHV